MAEPEAVAVPVSESTGTFSSLSPPPPPSSPPRVVGSPPPSPPSGPGSPSFTTPSLTPVPLPPPDLPPVPGPSRLHSSPSTTTLSSFPLLSPPDSAGAPLATPAEAFSDLALGTVLARAVPLPPSDLRGDDWLKSEEFYFALKRVDFHGTPLVAFNDTFRVLRDNRNTGRVFNRTPFPLQFSHDGNYLSFRMIIRGEPTAPFSTSNRGVAFTWLNVSANKNKVVPAFTGPGYDISLRPSLTRPE